MAEKGNRESIIKLYRKAWLGGYAIGAFNFSTMDLVHGIHETAIAMKAPVIIATSQGERNFFGCEESVAVYNVLKARHPPTILHADHTKTLEELKKVVDAGYPSVHFDGSGLDYLTNLEQTRKAVEYAHAHDVFIEGELGGIPGGSSLHKESIKSVAKEEYLTHPEQAKDFVNRTGVDSLAVNVGNAHGIWKDAPKLDFKRIQKIKELTGKFLVLHGGSGIRPIDFRRAIAHGITKININTEMRIAFEKAIEQGLAERTDDTPYKYLGHAHEAVAKVVRDKIVIFKSEKKA
ncbi:class II fructose-bisphosphate aldolase [Candidatus Woesearchaeota archaeon]|nr:class II fructose-bisphosphate aldolase [Candidatus Woesearchaeota archaeon]